MVYTKLCMCIYHVPIAIQYALNLLETYVGTWYTAHKDVFFSYCVPPGHVYTVITFLQYVHYYTQCIGKYHSSVGRMELVPVAHVPIRPTDS